MPTANRIGTYYYSSIKITTEDFDNYAYPLVEVGWSFGQYFSTKMYTYEDWQTITEEDILPLVPKVKEFIDTINQLIVSK